MLRTIIFSAIFYFSIFPVFSQKQGSISGKIRDKSSQEELAFVNLQLSNSTKGATTDESGNFRISNIPVGSYNLVVSYVGYKPFTLYI